MFMSGGVEERILFGGLVTFVSTLLLCPYWIALSRYFFCSDARHDTPDIHQRKNNTPTMGGIFILSIVCMQSCLWTDVRNAYVGIILLCLIMFGLLGVWDDWCKIVHKRGISAWTKFLAQLLCGAAVLYLWLFCASSTSMPKTILFIGDHLWHISVGIFLFFIWSLFILIGTSNAVNITDGLDGLAAGCLVPNFMCVSWLSYYQYWYNVYGVHTSYSGEAELAVLGAIFIGALLGFLWHNRYPAKLFMGDVGSLALGASLALMFLIIRCELVLAITGIVFVIETVSVIVQVVWYKKYKTRLLRLAPLHHHLEIIGWHETDITRLFSTLSFLLCIIMCMFTYFI